VGIGVAYDWYVVRNSHTGVKTKVKDASGKITNVDLRNAKLIPNGRADEFNALISSGSEESVDFIKGNAYVDPKKLKPSNNPNNLYCDTKSAKYKYPVAYTTNKSGVKWVYSKANDRGHFGQPKVIFSNGGASTPIVDRDGKYGLSQFAYAIVDKPEVLDKIKKAIENPRFIELISHSDSQTGHRYKPKAMGLMKKDFWKKFQD